MKNAIGILFLAMGLSTQVLAEKTDKGLYLIVTPKGTAKFHCKVEEAQIPEVQQMGQTPLRVHVLGGSAPYSWRLPLYQVTNGANGIAAAQIGKGKPGPDGSFIITVPTYELGRVDTDQPMSLEVRSRSGEAASCTVRTGGQSIAARTKATAPIQGAVSE